MGGIYQVVREQALNEFECYFVSVDVYEGRISQNIFMRKYGCT